MAYKIKTLQFLPECDTMRKILRGGFVMKKNIYLLIAVVLAVVIVIVNNANIKQTEQEIIKFIEENIQCFQEHENYITDSELQEKYESYDEPLPFYIGQIGSMKCYAEVNKVTYDAEPIDEILFTFKDSEGEESEKFTEQVAELCQSKYNGTLNDKYEVGKHPFSYSAVAIYLKNDIRDKCYAELSGITVEEYRREKQEFSAKIEAQVKSKMAIEENSSWLIVAAQKEVKKELSDPSSAKFPLFSDAYQITDMGDGVYAITVKVEHKNSFGGTVNSTFVVRLKGSSINNYTLVGIARM